MAQRRLATLVLLLASGVVFADDEETLKLLEQASVEQGGRGAIIELEEEEKSATSKAPRNRSGGKQVELIIGGSGEDGVAKRGALVIEE